MTSILVTGTNQGIGFGIVEDLAKRPDVGLIFATVRDANSATTDDLQKLASSSSKVKIIELQLNETSAAVSRYSSRFANRIGRGRGGSDASWWKGSWCFNQQYWHRSGSIWPRGYTSFRFSRTIWGKFPRASNRDGRISPTSSKGKQENHNEHVLNSEHSCSNVQFVARRECCV